MYTRLGWWLISPRIWILSKGLIYKNLQNIFIWSESIRIHLWPWIRVHFIVCNRIRVQSSSTIIQWEIWTSAQDYDNKWKKLSEIMGNMHITRCYMLLQLLFKVIFWLSHLGMEPFINSQASNKPSQQCHNLTINNLSGTLWGPPDFNLSFCMKSNSKGKWDLIWLKLYFSLWQLQVTELINRRLVWGWMDQLCNFRTWSGVAGDQSLERAGGPWFVLAPEVCGVWFCITRARARREGGPGETREAPGVHASLQGREVPGIAGENSRIYPQRVHIGACRDTHKGKCLRRMESCALNA